jgi:hypothetical protein
MSSLLTFLVWEFLEVCNLKLHDIDVLLKSTDMLLYLYHTWLVVSWRAENSFQLQNLDFLLQTSEVSRGADNSFQLHDLDFCSKLLNFLTFLCWKFLEVSNLQLQDLDLLLQTLDVLITDLP